MLDKTVMLFLAMFAAAPVPTGVGWQKDTTVSVHFVTDPQELDARCGGPLGPGTIILACVSNIGEKNMTLPNPCIYKNRDAYARVACHEMAHTNFWRHEYR